MDEDEVVDLTGRKRRLDDLSVDERLQRSRERNREHARRTRQRKKAQLATLQGRVTQLQEEGGRLARALDDCSAANLLLGLARESPEASVRKLPAPYAAPRYTPTALAAAMGAGEDGAPMASAPSRSNSRSPSAETESADDDDTTSHKSGDTGDDKAPSPSPSSASKPTIHWKNGYSLTAAGERVDLSPAELDTMRRERNRLHAKMTRDRKKIYVETLSRAVADLEAENARVRSSLSRQFNRTVGEPARYDARANEYEAYADDDETPVSW